MEHMGEALTVCSVAASERSKAPPGSVSKMGRGPCPLSATRWLLAVEFVHAAIQFRRGVDGSQSVLPR